jgi:hypothetical protein
VSSQENLLKAKETNIELGFIHNKQLQIMMIKIQITHKTIIINNKNLLLKLIQL